MLQDCFKFYYQVAQFKDILRQGAVQWRVDKERLESIAEHTLGCCVLAISLAEELKLPLNRGKVLEMLIIHELEELFIGDLTPLDNVNKEELRKNAYQKIKILVKDLNCKNDILALTNEFNEAKTLEAEFAKAVDKLECVLEFKKYQDNGQVSLDHVTDEMLQNKYLKAYVDEGKYDLADIFFLYHKPAYEKFGLTEEYWFNTLKNLEI